MEFLNAIYMALCGITSFLAAKFGYSNVLGGDKDILLPYSSMIFVFYSLLIYLPQTHFKTIKFQLRNIDDPKKSAQLEDSLFPISFLIALLSVIIAIGIHAAYKHYVNKQSVEQENQLVNKKKQNKTQQNNGHNHDPNAEVAQSSTSSLQQQQKKQQKGILKYFLSLALGLQNISVAYFISAGPAIFSQFSDQRIGSQIFIFGLFSLLINFAYGYLLGWSKVNNQLMTYLSIFTNSGLFFGFIFGLFLPQNLLILFLPCLSCGIFIYTSNFICLPHLFSNGQRPVQDKFRYGSIITSLLLSIVYYPFCYLLRV